MKSDYPYKNDKIVENWVTAGGKWSEEEVNHYLSYVSNALLVSEIFDNWKFKPAKTKDEIKKLVEEYKKNRKSK